MGDQALDLPAPIEGIGEADSQTGTLNWHSTLKQLGHCQLGLLSDSFLYRWIYIVLIDLTTGYVAFK